MILTAQLTAGNLWNAAFSEKILSKSLCLPAVGASCNLTLLLSGGKKSLYSKASALCGSKIACHG
jgi:hypothetical protein